MLVSDVQSTPQSPKAVIPYQNVQGWERGASLAGGLLLIARGLRKGGLFGMLSLGVGGMGLLRGVTGRCELKRVLERTGTTAAAEDLCTDNQPMTQLDMPAPTHANQDADQPACATPAAGPATPSA
nr:DUF2892 domain-containing protein [uncultured Pseudomonas sp.]